MNKTKIILNVASAIMLALTIVNVAATWKVHSSDAAARAKWATYEEVRSLDREVKLADNTKADNAPAYFPNTKAAPHTIDIDRGFSGVQRPDDAGAAYDFDVADAMRNLNRFTSGDEAQMSRQEIVSALQVLVVYTHDLLDQQGEDSKLTAFCATELRECADNLSSAAHALRILSTPPTKVTSSSKLGSGK